MTKDYFEKYLYETGKVSELLGFLRDIATDEKISAKLRKKINTILRDNDTSYVLPRIKETKVINHIIKMK